MRSPADEPTELSGRLRIARERAGLSQGQAAKLLRWHRPTLTEVEAGRRRVTADELAKFADLYGISVEWLLNRCLAQEGKLAAAAREIARLEPDELERLMEFVKTLRGRAAE